MDASNNGYIFTCSFSQPITCGLGERLINNQADTHQLFVDNDWQDSAIRELFI